MPRSRGFHVVDRWCRYCHRADPTRPSAWKWHSVDKLNFQFESCNSTAPLRILFENVHFPNVSTMKLRVEIPRDAYDSARTILHSIFPNAKAFPNLTSLTLDLHTVCGLPVDLIHILYPPCSRTFQNSNTLIPNQHSCTTSTCTIHDVCHSVANAEGTLTL